jgi:HEAT repeat protein
MNFKHYKKSKFQINLYKGVLLSLLMVLNLVSLAQAFSGNRPETREESEAWLKGQKLETDFESLTNYAQNPDSKSLVRIKSVIFLEKFFPGKSRDLLFKVGKNDVDWIVRDAASEGLARLGDKRAIPLLRKIMDKTTVTKIKVSTAEYLNRLGDISGFKYVLEAIHSKNWGKRRSGMKVMGRFLKSREAIEKKYGIYFLKEYLSFAKDPVLKIRM